MKNLILPFVVVTLFAIGSCGDEAVQPSVVNPKDTTNVKDTIIKKDSAEVKVNLNLQLYGNPLIYENIPRVPNDTVPFEIKISENFKKSGDTLLRIVSRNANNFEKTTLIIDSSRNIIHFSFTSFTGNYGQSKFDSWYDYQEKIVLKDIPFSRNNSLLLVSLDSTNTRMLVKEVLKSHYGVPSGNMGGGSGYKYDSLISTSGLQLEIKMP